MTSPLSPEKLKAIISKYVIDALTWEENYQSQKVLNPYAHEERLQDLEDIIHYHKEIVGEGRHRQALQRHAADLLKDEGIELDQKSPEFNKLCRLMAHADVKTSEVALKWQRGEYTAQDVQNVLYEMGVSDPAEKDSGPPPSTVAQPPEQPPSLTIGQLVSAYWKERVSGWKPRTKTEYETCRSRVLDMLGSDSLVSSLDYYSVKKFRDDLKSTNLSKSRVNLYIGFLKAVVNFEMQTTRILLANPCEGLRYKDTRRKDELRAVFDLDDLKAMFISSPGFGKDKIKRPERFWVPLLALYSGARMEELCQLFADQVQEVEGYWCLQIEAKYEGQSVKTSEKRTVPLSPFLLELGFHRYAQQQVGEGRLWPSLPRINNRWGHYFGRWFKEFKDKCGIDPRKGYKVFHSFRHNVETKLQYEEVEQRYIDQLLGHSNRAEAARYGKRFMERLHDNAVMKLDWHKQLDLSHLLKSKWAVPG